MHVAKAAAITDADAVRGASTPGSVGALSPEPSAEAGVLRPSCWARVGEMGVLASAGVPAASWRPAVITQCRPYSTRASTM